MAVEWKETCFGALVSFVSEKSKASEATLTNYISTENMIAEFGGISVAENIPCNGSVTKFIIGDVLFSNIRTYFKKVWQASFNGYCSNDVLVFRSADESKLLTDYIYHLCRWSKFTELSIRTAKGVKMPRGDKDALAKFHFQLPTLIAEQRAIAHILGTLDDKIELNRRMNETLEAIARAIFKSWFVDFDPVRAKASGEPPESICRRLGLTPDILALFPDRLVDSELGEIPEGWEVERIDRLLELSYGKALIAADRVNGVVPVYGSGGITGFHNASIVNGPGVIVGRKGTVGSLYWEDRPFYPIDTVFYVVPKVELTFCFYTLQTLELYRMNTDAAVPGLNRNNVYRLLIACPSGDLRIEYDRIARKIHQRMFIGQQESDSLTEIRDSLLPRLLSGKLRVPLEGMV
jgi:type I restriction enzyme S subunit